MAREVLGVAGAIIGGIYGGPKGAQIGYAVGTAVGSLIDGPEKIKGPALSEAPIQTSRDGVPIPIIWGMHHCHGNIIIKNAETYQTITTSQGKGGGTKTKEQHRYRTFGIGVCRGPIEGFSRIWENNKLVYDRRTYTTPVLPEAETAAFEEGMRLYLGGEDQNPDPDLEAEWGVGDTPYFRGLAYVVFVNKDLTTAGGAIPEYRFEVNGSADQSLTSKPYPANAVEGVQPTFTFPGGWAMDILQEAMEMTSNPETGKYGGTLLEYEWDEALEMTSNPEDGRYGGTLVTYSWAEAMEMTSIPVDGRYGGTLVTYSWDEALEMTSNPESGTLV